MAAYDQLLEGAGQDKFLQLYSKYDDTMTALKAGSSGQSFEGNGVGLAPSFKTRFVDIQIGDWDMNADATKAVTHGIADFKKIRIISITIRNDADSSYSLLDSNMSGGGNDPNGWHVSTTTTVINLQRSVGGDYDNTNYDSTSYNRGFITVYIAD